MDPERLTELAESIKAQGVIQPIVVRGVGRDRYEIIAGERRWRAAQQAGLVDVPVVVREVPDQAAIAMALIENIQREDLNPLEEATALSRLIREFELTHQQAAEAVGRSRAAATNFVFRSVQCNISPSSNLIWQTAVSGTNYLTVQVTADTSAVPGGRTMTCTWDTGYSQTGPVWIYDATPRIDSVNPSTLIYPGTTAVTFSGVGFGTSAPTLQFSPSGVAYSALPGNRPNLFTANITPPDAGDYQVTITSTGEGVSGFQSGGQTPSQPKSSAVNLHVTTKPRIITFNSQNNAAFWYLGPGISGSSGTGCSGKLYCVDGYYVQTRLFVQAPVNNTNPSPIIVWSTDSPGKLQLNDDASMTPTGLAEILTSLQPSDMAAATYKPPEQWAVHVTVTYDGIASDPFPVYINTPYSDQTVNMGRYCSDTGKCDCNAQGFFSGQAGYVTVSQNLPLDILSFVLNPIRIHETLENRVVVAGWQGAPAPIPGTWSAGVASQWVHDSDQNVWRFNDFLYVCTSQPGSLTPPPTASNSGNSIPAMTQTQKFWVGTSGGGQNPFTGVCIQRALLTLYDDHGNSSNQQTPGIPATICSPGNVISQ